jgi:hypothetical protein
MRPNGRSRVMFLVGKWAFLPVKGCSMKKVNLWFFYVLGAQLHSLVNARVDYLDSYEKEDIIDLAKEAEVVVKIMVEKQPTLRSSHDVGKRLLQSIEQLREWRKTATGEDWNDKNRAANPLFTEVVAGAKKLQEALENELPYMPVYHPSQKLIYSTPDLIEQAEAVLPESTLRKISEDVKTEIRESGKCLVFDVPTAAGFHILRATEIVLHQYYLVVCSPKKKDRLRDWGKYVSAFRELTEDTNTEENVRKHVKKVEALLDQIREQDRNLIMHPRTVLTTDDALVLFDTAKSVIMKMAERLPVQNAA